MKAMPAGTSSAPRILKGNSHTLSRVHRQLDISSSRDGKGK